MGYVKQALVAVGVALPMWGASRSAWNKLYGVLNFPISLKEPLMIGTAIVGTLTVASLAGNDHKCCCKKEEKKAEE